MTQRYLGKRSLHQVRAGGQVALDDPVPQLASHPLAERALGASQRRQWPGHVLVTSLIQHLPDSSARPGAAGAAAREPGGFKGRQTCVRGVSQMALAYGMPMRYGS